MTEQVNEKAPIPITQQLPEFIREIFSCPNRKQAGQNPSQQLLT